MPWTRSHRYSDAAGWRGIVPHEHDLVLRDRILCEFMKRSRSQSRSILERKLQENDDALKAAQAMLDTLPPESPRIDRISTRLHMLNYNVELLTVVRRMQEKPDPLAVIVNGIGELKGTTRRLPTLEVSLKNVDVDKRTFGLKRGGDVLSGRPSRWRIHVWDAEGNLLPDRQDYSKGKHGSGMSLGEGGLPYGRTWKQKLKMQDYAAIPKPGKYTVQVIYHNVASIAELKDPLALERLIVFRSEPFELLVEHGPKIVITVTATEMQRARRLIQELDEKQQVRIFYGKYDETAADFISPKSPQGQLLAMSWQAVPAIIEAIDDRSLSFRRHAWLFAILSSTARERDLDPTERDGVLPMYKVYGDIAVASGRDFEGGEFHVEEKYGRNSQWAYVREWLRFRDDYIDVVED